MFAKRLKELRERGGHSQESFGELLGVSKAQVYRWEKGDNEPSGESVANIARTLDVTTDYLLGLVDDTRSHITEEGLSPQKRRLLMAARSGDLAEILETALSISKRQKQRGIAGNNAAVNG